MELVYPSIVYQSIHPLPHSFIHCPVMYAAPYPEQLCQRCSYKYSDSLIKFSIPLLPHLFFHSPEINVRRSIPETTLSESLRYCDNPHWYCNNPHLIQWSGASSSTYNWKLISTNESCMLFKIRNSFIQNTLNRYSHYIQYKKRSISSSNSAEVELVYPTITPFCYLQASNVHSPIPKTTSSKALRYM